MLTPCLGALACRAVLQRLFAPTLKFLGPASQPPQRHANKGLCSLRDFLVPRPVWWRSARRLRELSDNTRAWLERTLAWIGPKEPPGLGIGAVGLCQVAPPQQPHSLWGCASFQPPRRACACLARTDIERAHTVFFFARVLQFTVERRVSDAVHGSASRSPSPFAHLNDVDLYMNGLGRTRSTPNSPGTRKDTASPGKVSAGAGPPA